MALANTPNYWEKNNNRQTKGLSDYIKSGGKDRTRLKNMKADIKYSGERLNEKKNNLAKKMK